MLLAMLDPDPLRDARALRFRGVLGMLACLAVGAFPSSSQAADSAPPAEDDGVDVDLSDFDPDTDVEDAEEADDTAAANNTASESPPSAAAATNDVGGSEEPDVDEFDAAVPTVSIIGEPEEQPRIVGSAHSVDQETLEREEHDDIHQVLRSVPGVYVRGEDGYGLRPNIGLRGADPNRSSKVTLMEDGILFGPAPYSAPAAYYFPMTTRLVGVEVFKGPAAVRFGPNTIGGAINLQTREIPRDLQTGIDVAAGTWAYGKLHGFAGKSWKRFGVLFEGARVRTGGFKELDGGGDTGFGKNEFMLKARLHGDPGARVYQQFDVKFGLSTEVSNETYLGLTDEDFAENPYRRYRASALDRMNWWRTQAQAAYFVATGIVEYQSTLYRHDFSRAWTKFNRFGGAAAPDPYSFFQNPTEGTNAIYLSVLRGESDSTSAEENLLIGTNQRDFVSQGWQNTLRISPNTRYVDQVIEVGARLHFDRVSRLEDEDQYAMLSGTPALIAGTQQLVAQNRGEALVGSFHVADEIRIVDRFTVSPGARVEVIRTEFEDSTPDAAGTPPLDPETSVSVDTVFLPGVGVHVQATRWLGVLGGVHSGFSPKAPGRGASVQAERSVNYEAGLRATHAGFRAEGIAFANDYSNLVSNCTFSQGCDSAEVGAQFSGGEVLIAGAESLAGYRTELGGAGWLDTTATYTYTWTRFSHTFSSSSPFLGEVERGDKVPYVPEHVASLQFAGGMRRWGAHAQLHFNGRMRDVPGKGAISSQERIERFVTLDLGGNVFLTPRSQLYLNLGNATRSSYAVSRRPFGLRPGRRFTLVAGFKHNFG
ncbi:MAG: TonB-dependent receptor [Nannocystaceae bacterium]|nr:TonB-dependent receptor [Nannocystaceae bacterium]